MLIKNKKVLLEERKVAINTAMNIQVEKIVADIFEFNFSKYFLKNNIKIGLDDILFISDSVTTPTISIPMDYLEEYDKLAKRLGVDAGDSIEVPCLNAYAFESKEYVKMAFTADRMPSLVILGFINNISENIYDNIMDIFGRTKIFIFGDETISGCEFGDYFSTLLTNSEYLLTYPYSDYRNCLHKKINSLLNKLRDKKYQSTSHIQTSNNILKRKVENNIDLDYLNNAIEDGTNVVVPRRMLTTINSKIKNMYGDKSEITITTGDTFYTRFPFVTTLNNMIVYIPPLSKVFVTISEDLETMRDGRRVVLRDLIITKPNGSKFNLSRVPIDYTGYLLQFDQNEHIDNYDDYQELDGSEDPSQFDPSTLSIMPHRIFTNMEQKYIKSSSLIVYLENLEVEVSYRNRTLWFQEMCNVLNDLEIITSNKFAEL